MYAKIENNQVVLAPYSIANLRKDNPNVSFPVDITDEIFAQFGIVKVVEPPRPTYNPETEIVQRKAIYFSGEHWTFDWEVLPVPEESLALKARTKRNQLLMDCDWTQGKDIPDSVSQAWAVYRQALRDLPQQAGFPHSIDWPENPEIDKVVN